MAYKRRVESGIYVSGIEDSNAGFEPTTFRLDFGCSKSDFPFEYSQELFRIRSCPSFTWKSHLVELIGVSEMVPRARFELANVGLEPTVLSVKLTEHGEETYVGLNVEPLSFICL